MNNKHIETIITSNKIGIFTLFPGIKINDDGITKRRNVNDFNNKSDQLELKKYLYSKDGLKVIRDGDVETKNTINIDDAKNDNSIIIKEILENIDCFTYCKHHTFNNKSLDFSTVPTEIIYGVITNDGFCFDKCSHFMNIYKKNDENSRVILKTSDVRDVDKVLLGTITSLSSNVSAYASTAKAVSEKEKEKINEMNKIFQKGESNETFPANIDDQDSKLNQVYIELSERRDFLDKLRKVTREIYDPSFYISLYPKKVIEKLQNIQDDLKLGLFEESDKDYASLFKNSFDNFKNTYESKINGIGKEKGKLLDFYNDFVANEIVSAKKNSEGKNKYDIRALEIMNSSDRIIANKIIDEISKMGILFNERNLLEKFTDENKGEFDDVERRNYLTDLLHKSLKKEVDDLVDRFNDPKTLIANLKDINYINEKKLDKLLDLSTSNDRKNFLHKLLLEIKNESIEPWVSEIINDYDIKKNFTDEDYIPIYSNDINYILDILSRIYDGEEISEIFGNDDFFNMNRYERKRYISNYLLSKNIVANILTLFDYSNDDNIKEEIYQQFLSKDFEELSIDDKINSIVTFIRNNVDYLNDKIQNKYKRYIEDYFTTGEGTTVYKNLSGEIDFKKYKHRNIAKLIEDKYNNVRKAINDIPIKNNEYGDKGKIGSKIGDLERNREQKSENLINDLMMGVSLGYISIFIVEKLNDNIKIYRNNNVLSASSQIQDTTSTWKEHIKNIKGLINDKIYDGDKSKKYSEDVLLLDNILTNENIVNLYKIRYNKIRNIYNSGTNYTYSEIIEQVTDSNVDLTKNINEIMEPIAKIIKSDDPVNYKKLTLLTKKKVAKYVEQLYSIMNDEVNNNVRYLEKMMFTRNL